VEVVGNGAKSFFKNRQENIYMMKDQGRPNTGLAGTIENGGGHNLCATMTMEGKRQNHLLYVIPPPPLSSSLQLQNGKKDFFALFLSVSTLALDYQYPPSEYDHSGGSASRYWVHMEWLPLKKKQFDNEFGALVATIHWYFHVGNHANTDAAAPAYYFKAS